MDNQNVITGLAQVLSYHMNYFTQSPYTSSCANSLARLTGRKARSTQSACQLSYDVPFSILFLCFLPNRTSRFHPSWSFWQSHTSTGPCCFVNTIETESKYVLPRVSSCACRLSFLGIFCSLRYRSTLVEPRVIQFPLFSIFLFSQMSSVKKVCLLLTS